MKNSAVILPEQTIGIIGGGQLGKFMAISAKNMGYKVAILEPTEQSPAAQVSDVHIVKKYDDPAGLKELAQVSDVITYEFENIDPHSLKWLEENSYLPQRSDVLEIITHRGREKQTIAKAGLPVVNHQLINSPYDLEQAIGKMGYPVVVKTTQGGYDGKGQKVVKSADDLQEAHQLIETQECIAEQWIDFQTEISVITHRNLDGQMTVLPVVENIHKDNILNTSIVPARVSQEIVDQAVHYALQLTEFLDIIGTLAVEMFVCEDKIFINELAPRPHNSGHYSLDGLEYSQFDQHIRAICNLPLASNTILKPTIMINILGQDYPSALENIKEGVPGLIYLYGKSEAKIGRKMGHVNFLADSLHDGLSQAQNFQKNFFGHVASKE